MKGLLAFVCLLPLMLPAQNYLMDGTPITDCNGTFYDPGGPSNNYGINQNFTTTLCADGNGGTHVRLSFSGVSLGPGDALCFYDGPSTASPQLSCSAEYTPGQPFVVQATAANPTGCLTVAFQSDGSGTGSGWAAAISCVASCQTVLSDLTGTFPAMSPADTGWIDICPGERVFFNGMGIYPQNNLFYPQSDLTTTFEWNFGDGGIAYGPNTSHRFDTPGGYIVQLVLTDTLGCTSTNLISQRVRVAPPPVFNLSTVSQICAGDTLHLNATVDTSVSGTTLSVSPSSASFETEASRSDSLALPDGTGELYQTSILLTQFSPGQILTNANDLQSICMNIEHSWLRDIEITLTCPNGQSIILHDHPGNFGGEVYLGEPNDNDNFNPVPGLGYDYCWTPNAPNPTWIQYINSTPVGTLPPGDYSTFDPISDLIGCPLNGEWTIGVVDLWAADNGYIFNWSLEFAPSLYPNIETFTPQFVSWSWNNHPSIYFATPDSISASPQNAGTAGYTFTVTDDFGCVWDTLLAVAVLPPTHPDCYVCATNFPPLQDANICAGESVVYDANSLTPPVQEVRFESYPEYRLGNANHPHANPYLSPLGVNSLGYNFLTNPIQQITSVCMDIETDFCADLNIFLRAPGGQQLMLSTGNGGAGDNYKITCFSPAATLPIVGQAAPFNGTYMPEGNWNTLAGAPVNGDWSLVVSDGFAPSQFGTVKWWSIGFNVQNSVNYAWTNPGGLSCTNCPAPTAAPLATTTYILTATDSYNCVHTDTATVFVNNFFPAPTGLTMTQLGPGTMTWVWNAVPSALGYQVSVNGGPWILPNNGALSHIVSGIAPDETVMIEVRCISPTACVPQVAGASSTFPGCTMFADLIDVTAVLCAEDTNGSALISISNSTFPVQLFLDNNPNPFLNGDLNNVLSGGAHTVIVVDALGCRDTLNFNTPAPPPLAPIATGTDVLCNGDNSGSLNATATGGTGAYGFVWQNCLGGPTLGGALQNNQIAGCYAVTVTDANGCTAADTLQINQPLPYTFVLESDSISCFGLSDGSAVIHVGGGTQPYQFLWDNGSTDSIALNLTPGNHIVTVTDANLCVASTFVVISQPPQLQITGIPVQNVSCFGGNNGAITVFPVGGSPVYQYLWNDPGAQTTQQATGLSAGAYTVTVSDRKGCTVTASATVGSPTALVIAFTNVAGEKCAGDCMGQATVSPSGGTGAYQFDWEDNTLPDLATVQSLCPGSYRVTVTDANNCSEVAQVMIAAATLIDAHFDNVDPSCSGQQNGSIDATISGGALPYQYLWSNGATTQDAQNLPCGTHALTLTDQLGCVQTYQILLDCPETLVITGITAQQVSCFGGNNGSAAVVATGGTAPVTYLWDDPATQTDSVAQNLSAGSYIVVVTDNNGCNTSTTVVVDQPSQLVATTMHTNASCLNSGDGTATANAGGGISPYSYNWGATGTTQTITNLAAGTFFVTVSDANQCTATASATIGQPATNVSVNATQTRFACFGESDGEASVSASGGNGAPFVFSWSNGQTGGGASNLATGLYTVTATDPKGCTGTQIVAIQQLDSIEVKVAYAPPTCAGYSDGIVGVVLIEGGLGMGDSTQYTYQWSLPGTPDATLVSGFAAGSYTLVVTDFQGCTGSVDFDVIEPPAIVLQTASENISCYGQSDGMAGITAVANATGVVNYVWNNNQTTAMINSLPPGNYIVTVTDAEGCTATASALITEPDPLTLVFTVDALVCSGDSNAAISVVISGGTPEYGYLWSNNQTTAEINNLIAGDYTLTVTDRNGCTLVEATTVEQPEALVFTTELTPPLCFGGRDGRIRLLVSGGDAPYRYRLNHGDFGGSSVFIALGAGTYTLQVRDDSGCLANDTVTLGQPLPVEVTADLDTTIILGDSVLLSAIVNNAVGMTQYEWESVLVDSFTCADLPDCEEIWVSPGFTNTYRLKVTDENGCMGRDEIRVTVEKPRGVYVPSGFTPNGDFENDLLVVHGKSRQVRRVLVFKVFDRWGELLYEDRDFPVNENARGWDGSFRNQPCDPGVYVWLLEAEYLDGQIELLKGDVTLIR
jgi:gliding motility-associated-like protein